MKKNTLLVIILTITFTKSFAQLDGRFGFTAGVTNYITKSDIVFTKSQPGFSIGVVGTGEFTERFGFMLELNYMQTYTKFVGRATPLSEPEDIQFKMGTFNVPFILNYNLLDVGNKLKFGLQAGPSLAITHDFNLADEEKSDYYLDPFYVQPNELAFDSANEKISLNTFLALGLSVTYDENLMFNFRYYKGLSNPYRNAPFYIAIDGVDVKSKENYYSFSVIYFIGD